MHVVQEQEKSIHCCMECNKCIINIKLPTRGRHTKRANATQRLKKVSQWLLSTKPI